MVPADPQTYPQILWKTGQVQVLKKRVKKPTKSALLRVAVNTPLDTYFDYRTPDPAPEFAPLPGSRVRVPFGHTTAIGVIVELTTTTNVDPAKLRNALEILDPEPLMDTATLELLRWAARYYKHPPGEVFAAAIPVALRKGRPVEATQVIWRITAAGETALDAGSLTRSPRQREVLALLIEHRECAAVDFRFLGGDWRRALRCLVAKGWAEKSERSVTGHDRLRSSQLEKAPTLTGHQDTALREILAARDRYRGFLLYGVTGSGKTEVYLRFMETVVADGKQALVLVPEIGLTPQLVERFQSRLDASLCVIHSGLTANERLEAYRTARNGQASIILGTRSAVFTPLKNAGAIIVDEEHDTSFKQQEGFRYSARDLAVARAKRLNIPVVLGSATPSLESLGNTRDGRYELLELPQRPGAARPPHVTLIDLRMHAGREGLSTPMLFAIDKHLKAGGQVLLYLNRRGYAPAFFCSQCGWIASCSRCDARMTYHRLDNILRCHHCDAQQKPVSACPECDEDVHAVGQGTERVEELLARQFAGYPIARMDRDKLRKKGELESVLHAVKTGETRILIGTQMLTKGHHFPDVTLVGILNADQGLFGTDFRSSERLAQTIVQVSGRAGRAERPGAVFIQTEFPEHPLLQLLVNEGYQTFADAALAERKAAHWPPFASLALFRVEATKKYLPIKFLDEVRKLAEPLVHSNVAVYGPAPAPMERRAGRYRAQLLIQSRSRTHLQRFLNDLVPQLAALKSARRVRWSLDVDPIELF